MAEAPHEIPTSWWERTLADKRRLAVFVAAVLAAIAALAALGVFVVWPLLADDADGGRGVPVGSLEPTQTPDSIDGGEGIDPDGAERDDAATDSDDGDGVASGGHGDGTDGPGGAGQMPGAGPAYVPEPFVAYRLDGAVWVAREDGTDPRQVASSAEVYALAPDGATLAIIDHGTLTLVTVSDGSRVEVGPAHPLGLAWHPDSSEVYFVRETDNGHGGSEVLVVGRTGGTAGVVTRGEAPAVGADGTVVALPPSGSVRIGRTVEGDTTSGSLLVVPPLGHSRTITVDAPALACDVFGSTIVYSVSDVASLDAGGEPDIRVLGVDGRGERRLVDPPRTARPFGYGELMISPDGRRLLYAETGDDGYSRAWVVALDGGRPMPLTVRRDTYPVRWSADSERVFFVEGNAFQGEATSLLSARHDGIDRRVVVQGASR